MTARITYVETARLYQSPFVEEDGLVRFIGNDPAGDPAVFFRWVNRPYGWQDREPWPSGPSGAQPLEPSKGRYSGWPGANPVRKPAGRPAKAEEERRIQLRFAVRRSEYMQLMATAASQQRTVEEWLEVMVQERLASEVTRG